MTNFILDWVRCNVCFRGFEQNGGILTSCGHFLCGRSGCQLTKTENGKLICPVCKSECGAISLSESLPSDILQFFEDPLEMLQKSINVLKFHNHQKELARLHYEKQQKKMKDLEKEIDELRKENKQLLESTKKIPILNSVDSIEKVQSSLKPECFIPSIIGQTPSNNVQTSKLGIPQKVLLIPRISESTPTDHQQSIDREESYQSRNNQKKSHRDDHEKVSSKMDDPSISKLFTPTLASRLQNLTGKKIYSPVQPK